jgi:hypothetical protein
LPGQARGRISRIWLEVGESRLSPRGEAFLPITNPAPIPNHFQSKAIDQMKRPQKSFSVEIKKSRTQGQRSHLPPRRLFALPVDETSTVIRPRNLKQLPNQ